MKQKTILLDDDCSLIDELSEKTHEALAEQLSQLIGECNATGRVVGLEGKWGSGKSTVVRILCEKLKALEKCFVFCTDAWGHEGDPLRKLFLLSLIDELNKSNRVDSDSKKSLNKIRKDVISKKSESMEEHTSLLSRFGKWVSFLTLFVPIGCVILDKTWDDVTIDFGLPIHWLFVIGVFLAIAPFWAFAYQFIHWLICKNKYTNRRPFALFDINAGRDFNHTVVSESEKDSVSFAESFKEILEEIKSSFSRLVIVIDNLDRVNHSDALKIWSTLQTFVRLKDKMESPKLWVVIPYTEEGIESLWENEKQDENDGSDVNVVKSFLDKTFQLRFEVPDLLIGDWQSFAEKKAKEVFVGFPESDVKLILDVLCWARRNSSDAPSPREIKLYLNQVRLLHEIHSKDGVRLSSICFYATKRYLRGMSRTSLESDLLKGGISSHSLPLDANNEHLVEDLCAILFHVSPEKGIQILLEGRIKCCLEQGKEADLKDMYQAHGDAFVGVLGYTLSHAPETAAFDYALSLQKGLGSASEQFHDMAILHWRDWLSNHSEQVPGKIRWPSITAFGDVVRSDSRLAEKTWTFFSSSFCNDLVERNFSPDMWVGCLKNVQQSYGIEPTILYSPGMFSMLKQCNVEEAKQVASSLQLSSDAEDTIANDIRPGHELDPRLPTAFSILIDAGLAFVDKTFEALLAAFTSNGNRGTQYYRMIACFDCLKNKDLRKRGILQFLGLPAVWACASLPNRNEEKNILGYLTAKYHETDSAQQISSSRKVPQNAVASILARWKTSSFPNASTIYQLTRRCGDYSYLRTLAVDRENVLVGDVVRNAIQDNDLQLGRGNDVLGLFSELIKFLSDEERNKLALLFISSEDIVHELESIQSGSLANLLPSFVLLLKNMKENESRRVRPGVERILSKASQNEWNKAFSSPVALVALLQKLKDCGSDLPLTTAFCEAFKQWLSAWFERREQENEPKLDGITVLFHFLNDAFKEDVAVRINQLAREKAFSLRSGEAGLVLGFSAHDKWTDVDGETICQAIQNAVTSKKRDELLLLVPILLAGLKHFNPSNRFSSTLKEPVEAWLKDAQDDVDKSLHELCVALNIELDPATPVRENTKL